MLKVIIVENNARQARYIRQLVEQRIMINPTPAEYDMKVVVQSADPDEVMKSLGHEDYLAILDIELDRQSNGMDVAEKIRHRANFAEIIFVTAYQEYLPYTVSRRIEPLDYISKGTKIESVSGRLRQDIDEAYARYQLFLNGPQEKRATFVYEPVRGVKRQIDLADLYFVESVKNKNRRLRIVGKNFLAEYHGNLSQIKTDKLIKVSQSVLVNPQNIVEFDKKKRVLYFTRDHEVKCAVAYRKVRLLNKLLSS